MATFTRNGGPGDDEVTPGGSVLDTYFMFGMGGDDTILGGSSGDLLVGGEANDVVRGDAYSFEGQTGPDRLMGDAGNDQLSGDGGHDTLEGGIGFDLLNGGPGNDLLTVDGFTPKGGGGADTLIGGAGDDTYVLFGENAVYAVDDPGYDRLEISGNISLRNGDGSDYTAIEEITLTGTGAFVAEGNGLGNTIRGNGAGNVLRGHGGSDTLYGNDGNDTLDGGAIYDLLIGGIGDDRYIVNDMDGILEEPGQGRDTVESSLRWVLAANFEDLVLSGTASVNGFGNNVPNRVTGNAGSNYLSGGLGYDTLTGGAGDDRYGLDDLNEVDPQSIAEYDQVIELPNGGIDKAFISYQGNLRATLPANVENGEVTGAAGLYLDGNALANILTGNSAVNQLAGYVGNDTLDGGGGADTLFGGPGDDTYIWDDLTFIDAQTGSHYDPVIELVNEGIDRILVSYQGNLRAFLPANVENGEVLGTAGLELFGNALPNTLRGNDAVNQLVGDAGNDVLVGRGGGDRLFGEAGFDVASYETSLLFVGVTADLAASSGNTGDAAGDSYSGIEGLIGSIFEDVLRGDNNANSISGGGSQLAGGGDILVGGGGNDTLAGGNGNDSLFGVAFAANGTFLPNSGADNVVTGDGDNGAWGGDGADTIAGGNGKDGFVGGAGDDFIDGADGNDFLFGGEFSSAGARLAGSGNDTLQGGAGGGGGNDALYGFDGNDFIDGRTGNDYAEAGEGADTVDGGRDSDTLLGQDGNDLINGGSGFDYLYGGAGADTFNLRRFDSYDVAWDFSAAQGDRLRLDPALGITSFAAFQAKLTGFTFDGVAYTKLNFASLGSNDEITVGGIAHTAWTAVMVEFA